MAEEISIGDKMAVGPEAGLKVQEAAFSTSEMEQTQEPLPQTQKPQTQELLLLMQQPPTKIATQPINTTPVLPAKPTFKVPAPPPPARHRRPIPMLMPLGRPPGGGYQCAVCRQNFFSFPQLVRHKQFHDEERPFPCGICGKRFLSRSHYNEHQRVHTGERPFPCDQCERSFTTHHNLKRHITIHSKEETYRCKTCGVLFCTRHAQEGYQFGLEELEQDYDSDPEPKPKPELKVQTGEPVLRQYRLDDKLQRKLQRSLMRQLKGRGRLPAPNVFSSLAASYKRKKDKKEKKKRKEEESKKNMNYAPGSSQSVSNKLHRIAYDIEVVL